MRKLIFLSVIFALNSQDQCPRNYTVASQLECPSPGTYTVQVSKQSGRAFNGSVTLSDSLSAAIANRIAFGYFLTRPTRHSVSATLRRNPRSPNRDWVLTVGIPRNVNSGSFRFKIQKAQGVAPCDFSAKGVGYSSNPIKEIAENALLAFQVKSNLATCSAMTGLTDPEVATRLDNCIRSQNGRRPVEKNCEGNIELVIQVN